MKNIEKVINEFSKEISDHYTIVVKMEDGGETKRFTFKDHKISALDKELKKYYGDRIARRITTALMKAETHRYLKNFAVDNSVDFIIGKDLKSLKTTFKEDIDEANIEFLDQSGANITVDGKPFKGTLGDLKAQFPKHWQILKQKLAKLGKSLANFGGNSPQVDIITKANGDVILDFDA